MDIFLPEAWKAIFLSLFFHLWFESLHVLSIFSSDNLFSSYFLFFSLISYFKQIILIRENCWSILFWCLVACLIFVVEGVHISVFPFNLSLMGTR